MFIFTDLLLAKILHLFFKPLKQCADRRIWGSQNKNNFCFTKEMLNGILNPGYNLLLYVTFLFCQPIQCIPHMPPCRIPQVGRIAKVGTVLPVGVLIEEFGGKIPKRHER